jgi:hypothetical protein
MIAMLLAACSPQDNAKPEDPAGEIIDRTITLDPPNQGYQLETPAYEIPPYTEQEICTVIQLAPEDDATLFWVNRMESLVSEGTHHMNVMLGQFSFLDAFMGEGASENALGVPEGQYPCEELSVMEVAYPVFPSQRESQRITLPEGVAAPLTSPLMLIFSHHYVNTLAKPVRINAALNFETIAPGEVTDVAGLVIDDIGELAVPPGTRQVASRTCVADRDVNVALVSTHSHQWGECATLHRYRSGEVETEPFFVNKGWEQPPILHFEPGTYALEPGDGVHWSCHYRNDTSREMVNDGTAEGEMCVFAAVTYPSSWSVAEVEETAASGDLGGLLALMEEALGPCDTVLETAEGPWSQEAVDIGDSEMACQDLEQTESNELQ